MKSYDLIIIGAGPGGYVAAIRASQLGLKVGLVEKDKPGGVCLNIGCIPSKALIHQAEMVEDIPHLEHLGIKVDKSGMDYRKVFDKSRKAATTLSKGVEFLLKKNNVELIQGEAVFKAAKVLTINGKEEITAKNIIVATGSSPTQIPGFEFDEDKILSSNGALMLEQLPQSLVILGSGAIGMEFTYIMNAFGVEVHLIEMLPRILPIEDEEISKHMEAVFRKKKVKIYTSTKAKSVKTSKTGITLTLDDKDGKEFEIKADKILVAVGRRPNTAGFGLDKAGVKLTERGFIETHDYYETSVPGIYAIGDVVASPLLAHVASKEGEIAVEHIAGHKVEKVIDPMEIPGATYCQPEVASFGLTEWKAKELKREYKTASFTYRGAGKSVAVEKSEGFVKVVYDPKTHEILGAHMVGANATEMIHEWLLAKKTELLPQDIATMIHAHPTLSEVNMEGARAIEGWVIHA